jgi:hypothetical protein
MTAKEYEFIFLTNISEAIEWLGDKFVKKIIIEGSEIGLVVNTSYGEIRAYVDEHFLIKSCDGDLTVLNNGNIRYFLANFEHIKGTCKEVC